MPKLTLNLSEELHRDLHDTARAKGITIKELVRRSFEINKLLSSYPDSELLVRRDGHEKEIVIL